MGKKTILCSVQEHSKFGFININFISSTSWKGFFLGDVGVGVIKRKFYWGILENLVPMLEAYKLVWLLVAWLSLCSDFMDPQMMRASNSSCNPIQIYFTNSFSFHDTELSINCGHDLWLSFCSISIPSAKKYDKMV